MRYSEQHPSLKQLVLVILLSFLVSSCYSFFIAIITGIAFFFFNKFFYKGKETLDSLILNKSQFETLVRDLLLVKQYRVEVYISKGGKSTTNWTLEYKVI
jgi:hypothetical protein